MNNDASFRFLDALSESSTPSRKRSLSKKKEMKKKLLEKKRKLLKLQKQKKQLKERQKKLDKEITVGKSVLKSIQKYFKEDTTRLNPSTPSLGQTINIQLQGGNVLLGNGTLVDSGEFQPNTSNKSGAVFTMLSPNGTSINIPDSIYTRMSSSKGLQQLISQESQSADIQIYSEPLGEKNPNQQTKAPQIPKYAVILYDKAELQGSTGYVLTGTSPRKGMININGLFSIVSIQKDVVIVTKL